MNFIIGTGAYNEYWQNMAQAMAEAGALGEYYTAWVDHYQSAWARGVRGKIGRCLPALDRQLQRRRMTTIPSQLIRTRPGWEILRTLAARGHVNPQLVDWIFIRSEYGLDRACANVLARPEFDGFMGIEHGALASLRRARELGKQGVVVFVSPHHTFRRRWVDAQYEQFPELLTDDTRRLLVLGAQRDARRDKEAAAASLIMTCSPLISDTLVDAGIPRSKIASVPLGAPEAIREDQLPAVQTGPVKFVYAGPVSVRKGAHHLLAAWKKLGASRQAELHFYGGMLLPPGARDGLGERVFFHGSVAREELFNAYRSAAALVFPTLCDGFGAVVTEALAQGLPVLTTPNAGAAAFIKDGVNGFVTPAGNVEALADRLVWCLEHPAELREMKRAALATARAWSWKHFRSAFSLAMDLPQRRAA